MSVTSSLSVSRSTPAMMSARFSLCGQRLGLGVGGLFGERVDGGAARLGPAHRVGMDGDEQVCLVLARDAHAVLQA